MHFRAEVKRVPSWPSFADSGVPHFPELSAQATWYIPELLKDLIESGLETDRLRVRKLSSADQNDLFALFSDPEVTRFWAWPAWQDPLQAETFLADVEESYQIAKYAALGIELKASSRLIGTLTVLHYSAQCRRAEVGYSLARPMWGQGLMREAAEALIRYLFERLDLNRIEADIHPDNAASRKLLEHLGFRKEGYFRERWIVNGEISDSEMYGLLRSEWRH